MGVAFVAQGALAFGARGPGGFSRRRRCSEPEALATVNRRISISLFFAPALPYLAGVFYADAFGFGAAFCFAITKLEILS